MRPQTLLYFARIKPLAAWSISGSAVGVGVAAYLTHGNIVAIFPMLLAIVAVVLMQYVAHPMNDIMDYELDRQAPIEVTGRVKPIVDGLISMDEAKWLSRGLVAAIAIILLYLIARQPLLIFPAAYGMMALIGYNHPKMKLAYKPFSELYLSMPINALTVFVISYIGSGQFSWIAVAVSIAFGFSSSAFFVSMMSMDFPTDSRNGKRTTIVTFPRLRWCTFFPTLGCVAVMLSPLLMAPYFGLRQSILFLALSMLAFIILVFLGKKVDELRLEYLRDQTKDPEGKTGELRLYQLYVSIAYAAILTCFFLALK